MVVSALCQRANHMVGDFVGISTYPYTSCYLWHDSPLYDPFGEVIGDYNGNTVYLSNHSARPAEDLFHELGHAVARHFDVIGHRENGWKGHWDRNARRLVATIRHRRHWSRSLELYAWQNPSFEGNALSETWAELFMLHHLYPELEEARLVDDEMARLRRVARFRNLGAALLDLSEQLLEPEI